MWNSRTPDQASQALVGGAEVVLLVEDDAEVRALAETSLARHGYTVLSAPDGQTALELAATVDSIDLLITDVMMPGLLGPEVAERLRAVRPGLRVVYISVYAAEAVDVIDGFSGDQAEGDCMDTEHGGRAWAEGKVNEATAFYLPLPKRGGL